MEYNRCTVRQASDIEFFPKAKRSTYDVSSRFLVVVDQSSMTVWDASKYAWFAWITFQLIPRPFRIQQSLQRAYVSIQVNWERDNMIQLHTNFTSTRHISSDGMKKQARRDGRVVYLNSVRVRTLFNQWFVKSKRRPLWRAKGRFPCSGASQPLLSLRQSATPRPVGSLAGQQRVWCISLDSRHNRNLHLHMLIME